MCDNDVTSAGSARRGKGVRERAIEAVSLLYPDMGMYLPGIGSASPEPVEPSAQFRASLARELYRRLVQAEEKYEAGRDH